MHFSILIVFLIEFPVSKQWRPWSDAGADAAFSGVWSGSALFAYVPEMLGEAILMTE